MKKKLFSTLILALTIQTLFPQKGIMVRSDGKVLSEAAIDSIVQKLMDTAGVTGLSLGIINNYEVKYVKSYGYKKKLENQLNNTGTSFYAASLSKPLFAYLVMQLVDKGLIDLDKPLYKYLPGPLPEYENYKDLAGDERYKLITARQCLSHTTGFPNWRQLNPNGSRKLQIFFTPGTRYAYSGEGVYLLQFVIEAITKQKLEELAQKLIFKPFGMTRTSFIWQTYFDTDHAVGHNNDEDTLTLIKRTEANAAGSMQTTIDDYTRFMLCVMQGKGLSDRSKKEMLSQQITILTKHQFPSLNNDTTNQYKEIKLSYGLGWGLFKTDYGTAFFKEGHGTDGWEHYAIGFPDKRNALVIMTNSLNGESIFKELIEVLAGVTVPWEWEGYTPYQSTVKVPENILKEYVGHYTGRFEASVSLQNAQLKIEAPAEGLGKTNLYPGAENIFFMKSIPVSLEFIKQPDGKIKAKVNDEGELYELNKVDTPDSTTKKITISGNTLSACVGTYSLTGNPKRTLEVTLEKDNLMAKIPGQEPLELVFISDSTFKVRSVTEITGEFITENGKVTKLLIDQNGKYEWQKLK